MYPNQPSIESLPHGREGSLSQPRSVFASSFRRTRKRPSFSHFVVLQTGEWDWWDFHKGRRGNAWESCHHMASLSSQHSTPHEITGSHPTTPGILPPPDGWCLLLMTETKCCQCGSTLLTRPGQEKRKIILIGLECRWEITSWQICWLSPRCPSNPFPLLDHNRSKGFPTYFSPPALSFTWEFPAYSKAKEDL